MAREWRIERDGDDEEKNNDRWLVTYADMITVLMIFFIVLYALSAKISLKNFEQLAKSLNNTLTKKKIINSPQDPFAPTTDNRSTVEDESKEVRKALAPFKGKSQVKVDLTDRGLVISLADTSFFDLGSTDLKQEGKAALLKIAAVVATESNAISVEGHSDNTPSGTQDNSNWLIAATRAANVASFLSEQGKVPAKRFRVVSFGEYKPLFPNNSPEHKAMNRRVDIVIMKEAPTPAMTPRPDPSVDTLPPAFGNQNPVPTPPPFNRPAGDGIPNPFGNTF